MNSPKCFQLYIFLGTQKLLMVTLNIIGLPPPPPLATRAATSSLLAAPEGEEGLQHRPPNQQPPLEMLEPIWPEFRYRGMFPLE